MKVLKQIIEGHLNEFKSAAGLTAEDQEEVYKSRASICLSCPLKSGNKCDPKLSINPITLEVVETKNRRPGFIKGCGCRLSAKQRSLSSECPAGFWGKEFKN